MSGTVAEVRIPIDEFALAETMAAYDDLRFEIERIIAHEPDRVMPYVWISDADFERLDDRLEADESVDRFELMADVDGERLYRMGWVGQIRTLVQILVEEEGTILSAQGNTAGWTLRILFPERASLSRTYEFCQSNDLSLEIQSIYDIDSGRQGRFGLTDGQQDVLQAAYEHGYYRIPREITAEELAAEFGISHQAVSERLRRAHESLVESTIVIGDPDDRE